MILDDLKEIVYVIPNHCGHLPFVKNNIERIKKLCDNLTVFEGLLTDIDSILKHTRENEHSLLIYDDMFTDIINSRAFNHLATFGARHHNCCLIVTSQNLFEVGRYSVSIRRQFSYYTIYYPNSERNMIVTLGRNLFPTNPMVLLNCFRNLHS